MAHYFGKRDADLRSNATARARATGLRRETTPPEDALWSRLRRKQVGGFRFRRQHALGEFVADFYCHDAALVIEVDSSYHDRDHDEQRDLWMSQHGIAVVRVSAGDVAADVDAVLRTIQRALQERIEHPHPSPPPHAGEGAKPPTPVDAEIRAEPSSPACGGGVAEGDGGGDPNMHIT
ncbi:MAG: hypothetical protein DHS20C14_11070 [Phycisphaeraceae bacterium]|nr:MAG: hypothetical protein DHS20C14_11070 [Phycisphaeraceae bacterium]